jgi:hypothetical protein
MTHISQDYKHLEEKNEHLGHVVYDWSSLADGIAFLNEHGAQLISARELVQAQLATRKKQFDAHQRLTTLEEAINREDVCVAEAVVYRPHDRAVFIRNSPILDPWSDDGKRFVPRHAWLIQQDQEHELRLPWKAEEYARDALKLEESKQDVSTRDFLIPLEFQPFTLKTDSNSFGDEVAHNFRYTRAYEHPLVRWLCQETENQAWTNESFSDLHRFYRHPWVKIDILDKHYIDKQEKPFLKQIAISRLVDRCASADFSHIYCDVPKDKALLFIGKIKEKQ